MICLKLNRFFYGLSRMLHLSEFVWILRSSVLVVFNNFLHIDATDRSKISSDQKRFFIALSLYPLSFFANSPFNQTNKIDRSPFLFSKTNQKLSRGDYFNFQTNLFSFSISSFQKFHEKVFP